jgi:phosphoglycolate phosphatase
MSRQFDLVIFDWDGTLFDSVAQIVDSLLFAAQCFQLPLSAHAAKDVIGLGLTEVMQRLFPQAPALHQQIAAKYAEHYLQHAAQDTWFAGVADMLVALRQAQKILAVATGKSRQGLDRVLTHTQSQQFFAITRAASETRSKPDPLMLQEILQHTGIALERTVMVGDSCYDLAMAQGIGIASIAVSYGVHQVAALAQYNPVYIAKNVAELRAYLLDH